MSNQENPNSAVDEVVQETAESATEAVSAVAASAASEAVSDAAEAVDEAKMEEHHNRLRYDRKNLQNVTKENDIKFKGILSYRHLRILGWICMAAAQACIFVRLAEKFSPGDAGGYQTTEFILSTMGDFALFLFLFANFATLLDRRSTYKKLFILNGSLTALFAAAYFLIRDRYVAGIVDAVSDSGYEGVRTVMNSLGVKSTEVAEGVEMRTKVMSFNVFLDLLLCVAIIFFLNYRPKKYFQGKNLIWFRLMVLIPCAYEVGSIALKVMATQGGVDLPNGIYPFLTTKPVACFLLFLTTALYMKRQETKYLKTGKTYEDYEAFLGTNVNSLKFSKRFALRVFLFGILDLLVFFLLFFILITNQIDFEAVEELTDEHWNIIFAQWDMIEAWGIGTATPMIFFSPFILLFSYTKRHKNPKIDTFVSIIGVGLIVIVYIEGLFYVAKQLPAYVTNVLGD